MGYYTVYTLDVETGGEGIEGIAEYISSDEELSEAFGVVSDISSFREINKRRIEISEISFEGGCETKIYGETIRKNMAAMSRAFPKALFTVHGCGEEDADFWIAYYRGGKEQYSMAEIVYPEFDPDKLISPESGEVS